MFNPANQTHFSLTLDGQRHDLQVLEFHDREVNWTRQEYNDSTFNLTVLAQIEPRPSAGTSATVLASHFPTAP